MPGHAQTSPNMQLRAGECHTCGTAVALFTKNSMIGMRVGMPMAETMLLASLQTCCAQRIQ